MHPAPTSHPPLSMVADHTALDGSSSRRSTSHFRPPSRQKHAAGHLHQTPARRQQPPGEDGHPQGTPAAFGVQPRGPRGRTLPPVPALPEAPSPPRSLELQPGKEADTWADENWVLPAEDSWKIPKPPALDELRRRDWEARREPLAHAVEIIGLPERHSDAREVRLMPRWEASEHPRRHSHKGREQQPPRLVARAALPDFPTPATVEEPPQRKRSVPRRALPSPPAAAEDSHLQEQPSESEFAEAQATVLLERGGSGGRPVLSGRSGSGGGPEQSVPREGVRAVGTDGLVEVVPCAIHERLVKAQGVKKRPPRSVILFRRSAEEAVLAEAVAAGLVPGVNRRSSAPVPEEESPAQAANEVACPICCLEKLDARVDFGCGAHFSCGDCAEHHAKAQLTMGLVPTCMGPGCGVTLHPRVAQQILEARDFERYILATLRESTCVRTCPKCSLTVCVEGLGPKAERPGAPGYGIGVRCPGCKHRFCAVCELDQHSGVKCEVARAQVADRRAKNDALEVQKMFNELGLKCCPSCGVAGEKADKSACDHITCGKCGHEFCWQCLADRTVIYAHGNHFHFASCPYHSPYYGPLEYLPKRCKVCKRNRKACPPPPQGPERL